MITSRNADVRRFTKEDWFGFAGSTRFADGSVPFIADAHFEGVQDATLIADAEGVGCLVCFDGADEVTSFYLPLAANQVAVLGVLEHLLTQPVIRRAYLLECGFEAC